MATSKSDSTGRPYDAAVVGAGVIGLSAAWRAAQRGLRVLVLDAAAPASGATRVAAGMLAPVTEATFGEEDLVALNLESARRYPEFVAELEDETGIDTGYRPCGTLAVARDRDDAELLRQLHRFQSSLGLEADWLSGRECRNLEPALAPGIVGGIRSSVDHRVTPQALGEALVQALERAGGEFRGSTPVARVTVGSDSVAGVTLESGERVAAEQVVVAAGWRSGGLEGLPEDDRVPVRPVKGQIIRLQGDPGLPLARRVVRTPEVYIVPREGGELIVGATVEERGSDATVTAGGVLDLLRQAYEALPGITELELVRAEAGLRPASPDNKPIVGSGSIDGLVWATAHWRHGILLAPVTADAVTELLTGGSVPDRFAPFSAARFGVRSRDVQTAAAGGGRR